MHYVREWVMRRNRSSKYPLDDGMLTPAHLAEIDRLVPQARARNVISLLFSSTIPRAAASATAGQQRNAPRRIDR